MKMHPVIYGILAEVVAMVLLDATAAEGFIIFMLAWLVGYFFNKEENE